MMILRPTLLSLSPLIAIVRVHGVVQRRRYRYQKLQATYTSIGGPCDDQGTSLTHNVKCYSGLKCFEQTDTDKSKNLSDVIAILQRILQSCLSFQGKVEVQVLLR